MFVAEKFTGLKGVYIPLSETLSSFDMLISGELDDCPEEAFYNVGTAKEVIEKTERLKESGR